MLINHALLRHILSERNISKTDFSKRSHLNICLCNDLLNGTLPINTAMISKLKRTLASYDIDKVLIKRIIAPHFTKTHTKAFNHSKFPGGKNEKRSQIL
jgi:predicted transcriptional regulator